MRTNAQITVTEFDEDKLISRIKELQKAEIIIDSVNIPEVYRDAVEKSSKYSEGKFLDILIMFYIG